MSGQRKRGRISRSGDFNRAYREGRSHSSRHLVLYAFPRRPENPSDQAEIRLGVSVGRRVGDAVDRNRVKRCLREAFWASADDLPANHDFVLVARPEIGDVIEKEGANGAEELVRELVAKLKGGEG